LLDAIQSAKARFHEALVADRTNPAGAAWP